MAKPTHMTPVRSATNRILCGGSGKLLEGAGSSLHAMRTRPQFRRRGVDRARPSAGYSSPPQRGHLRVSATSLISVSCGTYAHLPHTRPRATAMRRLREAT